MKQAQIQSYSMEKKDHLSITKQSTQSIFKLNPAYTSPSIFESRSSSQLQTTSLNPHGIYLSHQQKIQATYNFQSLFRKKSQIYNLNRNKKKLLSKNFKNESIKNDDPDKEIKSVKIGHWTAEQNRKYHWFLQLHNKHFVQRHLRRIDKIFKTMSAFIGTRQAQQCRSHHQKMEKKYKKFYHIIIKLRMEYYGTCNTESVRADLEQNGYLKENKESLIEQNTLKNMQKAKEEQSKIDKEECKKTGDDDHISLIHENNSLDNDVDSRSMPDEQDDGKDIQGHLFFGQNYQKDLSYKLY